MAQQKLDIQLKGLWTSPNNLSAVPQGALEVADNVVINTKSIIESRRGQTQYGSPLTIGSGQVNKIFNYASSLIANYDNKMAYDAGSGVWTDYSGIYNAPSDGYKMRSLEALKNFYFTTDEGIFKLDELTATPKRAGVVRALGGSATLTGASGFLADDSAVAYRLVWGYTDANNNLLLGAPSQRLVISNSTGGTRDVVLTFTIPASITTSYFYQIYRSNGTATAADEPNDELQLVLQANPTAAEITAKSFTVTDETPYSLMRATLYTSPSQEGIANANYEPPFALDMDIFKGSAFYANTRQKQRLSLALISIGSPSFGYVDDVGITITSGSPILGVTDSSILRVGMRIVGTGIPPGFTTRIKSIDTPTQITMNANATASVSPGVQFQDRFTIGDVDYWAGDVQNPAINEFLVDTSGTPGQNINNSAINLLQLVNTSPLNTTIYGYYISALNDLPGQMLFEERSVGGDTFYATSTAGTSFSPEIPNTQIITSNSVANPTMVTTNIVHGLVTGDVIKIYDSNSTPTITGQYTVTVLSSTTFSVPVHVTIAGSSGFFFKSSDYVASDNDARQNRVAISKASQVEAVPIYTYFDIGSANFPIQRVVALRDGIFFFKTDGIYRLSGETFANFTVTLVDNTVTLKAPESAVPFNNQVFCFTTQGVCAVTDSGVQIMSVPIEDVLLELSSDQFTNFSSASFGVAYESARQYLFFTVTNEDDEFATQAFVYNSLTDTWTRWIMNRTCGVVNSTINKLFMAESDTGQILIERKSYTNDDYADEEFSVTIASVISTTEITLSSVTNVEVGMTIVRGARRALIEDIVGTTLTISAVSGLTTGAAIVYTPIENKIQWAPIDAENPGLLKRFSEMTLFFRNAAFQEIDAAFSTNISLATEVVPIENTSTDGWGRLPWGSFPWGGQVGGQNVLRTYVPRDKQLCSWLTLSLRTEEAFTGFSLQGISLIYNVTSPRIK